MVEKMQRQRRAWTFFADMQGSKVVPARLGINFLQHPARRHHVYSNTNYAMSRTASRRLLAQSPLTLTSELGATYRLPSQCLRPFSNTTRRKEEDDETKFPSRSTPPTSPSRPSFPSAPRSQSSLPPKSPSLNKSSLQMSGLFDMFAENRAARPKFPQGGRRSTVYNTNMLDSDGESGNLIADEAALRRERSHQMHIYATRHNVHITLARPPGYLNKLTGVKYKDRTNAISVSAGNLGFRHSARKHYDSAFQLASYVMGVMKEKGITAEIQQLEVFLRGFGAGREAVTKALLGLEGAQLRGKIVKVSDATRLKFGGTRSKKPRRLG